MQTQTPQPQLAKFTKKHVIIKDYNYYKGSQNLWNNLAHFDNKIYAQFHKQNHKQQSMIDQKLKQEELDHKFFEEFRKRDYMNKKSEDLSRYYQRIQERELIQTKSKQNTEDADIYDSIGRNEDALDELVAKKVNASRYTRLNENSWNYQNGYSRKYVNQYLTPAVLKGEEHRVQVVKKAVEIAKFEKTMEEQRKHDLQQEIKENFATRREQNKEVHTKIGLPSRSADGQGFLRNLDIKQREHTPTESIMPQSKRIETGRDSMSVADPFKFDRRDSKPSVNESIGTNNKLQRSSLEDATFQRLALPKRTVTKTFELAQTELQGSLINNMDREIFDPNNEFCKSLVNKSKVCQEAHEERRTTGRRTVYTKSIRNQSLPPIEDESYSIRDSMTDVPVTETNRRVNVINIEDPSFPIAQPFITTPVVDGLSRQRRDVLDDISDFEKRFSSMNIRSGYSRKDLEQTYKGLLPAAINKELVKRKEVVRRESSNPSADIEQLIPIEKFNANYEEEEY